MVGGLDKMPRTDKRPLAEINIQKPGKITTLDEIKFKKIAERKMIINTLISLAGEKR